MERAWGQGGVLALGLLLAIARPLAGDLIASWDFNDSDLVVDQGSGTLVVHFPAADIDFFSGTTKNARPGVAAGQSLSVRGQSNNGSRAEFSISMAGRRDLVMSLAMQRSGTGFNNNQLAYSTNGGSTFTDFGSTFSPTTSSFDTLTFDLSSVTTLNETPDAVLRLTFAGATSSTGSNRLDNVQFNANPIATPEPPVWLLSIGGSLLAAWRWRRRLRETDGGACWISRWALAHGFYRAHRSAGTRR